MSIPRGVRIDGVCLAELSAFDFTKSGQASPVDIEKSVTLLDQSVSCPASGNIPAITESVKIGEDIRRSILIISFLTVYNV